MTEFERCIAMSLEWSGLPRKWIRIFTHTVAPSTLKFADGSEAEAHDNFIAQRWQQTSRPEVLLAPFECVKLWGVGTYDEATFCPRCNHCHIPNAPPANHDRKLK